MSLTLPQSKEERTNITCLPKFLPDTLPTKRKDTAKAEEEAETIGTKVENLTTEAKSLKIKLKLKTKNKFL